MPPAEETNIFEIPVTQDKPYVIPGTRIGVTTDYPIQDSETHVKLLQEVNEHLRDLKEALRRDRRKQAPPASQNLPLNQQLDNLTHNEKLQAITDLCTVRKDLESAIISDSMERSFRESCHAASQSQTKSAKEGAPHTQERRPEKSPSPQRFPPVHLMSHEDNCLQMAKSYSQKSGDLYNKQYIAAMNDSIDQAIEKTRRMEQKERELRCQKKPIVRCYHDDSKIPDQTQALPTHPEEKEFVQECVRRSIHDAAYRERIKFVKMIPNSKSLDQRADERMYSIVKAPNFSVDAKDVKIVSGGDYVEETTREEKAMRQYQKKAAQVIRQQLAEQEEERRRRQEYLDYQEYLYQQRLMEDKKRQIRVRLQNKFNQEMKRNEYNIKRHILDIITEKKAKEACQSGKMVPQKNCDAIRAVPAPPAQRTIVTNLPSFSDQLVNQVQQEYQKYQKYPGESLLKRFSDQLLDNLLNSAVVEMVKGQQRAVGVAVE